MRLVAAVLSAALAFGTAKSFAQAPTATSGDQEAAKAHFLAGSAYYEQANYPDAVKEFNEAYRLSKRPDLLYNIALCYERLEQLDLAVGALRTYLRDKVDAPDRAIIEERIRNLELKEAQRANPPVMAERAPPKPEPARHHFRDVMPAVIVGSVGAAILIASLGTGLAAHGLHEDLASKCPNNHCPDDPSLKSERDTGDALAISSDALLAVGAAALAVGIVLLIIELRAPPKVASLFLPSPSSPLVAPRFALAPGGFSVRW